MSKLLNAFIVVALFAGAWTLYTRWIEDAADPGPSVDTSGFNCRTSLASLAEMYRCRDDANCEMTGDDFSRLRQLEADIDTNCN